MGEVKEKSSQLEAIATKLSFEFRYWDLFMISTLRLLRHPSLRSGFLAMTGGMCLAMTTVIAPFLFVIASEAWQSQKSLLSLEGRGIR